MNLYMNFLMYVSTAIGLLILGMILFTMTTPKIKEFSLIASGNIAAALLLGGKLIGLAFVLGAAAEYSISLVDMALWGLIGIIAQVVLFGIAELVTIRFSLQKAIQNDNRSVALTLFSLSIAVGWIVAKCLSY